MSQPLSQAAVRFYVYSIPKAEAIMAAVKREAVINPTASVWNW